MKKVPLGIKPSKSNKALTAEEWVNGSDEKQGEKQDDKQAASSTPSLETSSQNESMKRLTIDVSEDLHTRIKAACALRGVKMADEIRALLDGHFPTAKGK